MISQISAVEVAHDGVLQADGQHGAHDQERSKQVGPVRDCPEEIDLRNQRE